ncbi:potassium channel family protein [Luteibaculum oceani]|uniref:TrkA family potassium uptake protein n=1 Tax=Luteibaculum oceani TaxID=1294296 RepID=A0A5C6VJW9_9FLAO|nr:TrkA family potassium uptake protein [Luteibaculum oceani]TXC85209.1 TrkA family potassium uptake protein [Luteibaculum oceani]
MKRGRRFAVIGVGRYGATIGRKLAAKGAEVYAIDSDKEKIDALKDDVSLAVTLDSTDIRALESQNIQDVDAAIIAIGENFQAVILTALNLLELQVPRVIARSGSASQKLILEKIGVEEILTPEDEVAALVTERLINPSVLSFLELPDNYEIAEIKAPSSIINKTIEEIGLRNKYSLTLITIKRETRIQQKDQEICEQHIIGVPRSETIVKENDTIVVFGTLKDVQRFIEINE